MAPVAVELASGFPARFVERRKARRVVEILETWREQGRWWEGEEECELYLVLTDVGVRLLMRGLEGGQWYAKAVR